MTTDKPLESKARVCDKVPVVLWTGWREARRTQEAALWRRGEIVRTDNQVTDGPGALELEVCSGALLCGWASRR